MTKTILETCDIWDTDYKPEFRTIFATWQLRVTLDSIRNSCDVYIKYLMLVDIPELLKLFWNAKSFPYQESKRLRNPKLGWFSKDTLAGTHLKILSLD